MKSACFSDEIERFVDHIRSLYSSLPLVMHVMGLVNKRNKLQLDAMIRDEKVERVSDGSRTVFTVDTASRSELNQLLKRYKGTQISHKLLPRSFVVSLVSQFDVFLGSLMRVIYCLKPSVLFASEQNFTASQIFGYQSIDEIKEHVIESEIETLLRKSHAEQFDWLERKLKLELRKGLDVWPLFIEVTERRNLFVHCDGKVSSQYIRVCERHGYKIPGSVSLGYALQVDPKYFETAYSCIFEIGVKLGSVLWRKFEPNKREQADSILNDICYDLIMDKRYDLAINILEFATGLPEFSGKQMEYMFIINKAQAYKWNSDEDRCREVLGSVDWVACSDEFRLANAVLTDRFDEAAVIMLRMGKNGSVEKNEYGEWPLFRRFRKSESFQEAYQELFGESFESVRSEVISSNELDDGKSIDCGANREVAVAEDTKDEE